MTYEERGIAPAAEIHHREFEGLCVSTPRLALIPLAELDSSAVSQWRTRPSNALQFWADRGPTHREQVEWFRSPRWNRADFLIWHRADAKGIGTLSLANIDPLAGTAVKGTMIGEEGYRKQGLAYEANCGWLAFAFLGLQLRALLAQIRTVNTDSVRLNRRLGMQTHDSMPSVTHPTRGTYNFFSISREQYEANRSAGAYPVNVHLRDAEAFFASNPEIGNRYQ